MDFLITYAMLQVGTPYKWGGDNPIEGYDCSGFVQEVLKAGGAHPDGRSDFNAQGLFNYYENRGTWNKHKAGALVFYGKSVTQITHVAWMIDPFRIIEAGGGGSSTVNDSEAAKRDAFVRIRTLDHRSDRVAIIYPDYSKIGLIY